MKVPMEKKIIDAAEEIAGKCMSIDMVFLLGASQDPKLVESFEKFVNALKEAEEKKMYSSLKSALKKLGTN